MIKTLEDIILELNPSIRELRGFDGFDVNGKSVSYDKSAAETKYASQDYARKRVAEYPSIADQLDDIYHNGVDAWKATIKATKDKYPKE